MNDISGRHLAEEELLGFLDHELPRREFAAVRDHLSTCWKCQTQLTELRETIAEFVRCQQKSSQIESELNPAGWPDLRRRMRDTAEAAEASRRIPGPGLRWGAFGKIALAGAALAALALASIAVIRYETRVVPPPPVPSPTEARSPAPGNNRAPILLTPRPHTTAAVPPLHVEREGGLRAEVGALLALHDLQADLGEPIRLETAPNGRVAITADGLTRDREAELVSALGGRPDITLRFEQPSSLAKTPPPARTRAVTPANAALNAALEPALGGPAEVQAFANAVVDESEEMMARAYAIHNLAVRLPESRRQILNNDEKGALARIEADHRRQLAAHARRISTLLATLRKTPGEAASATPPAAPANLFDSARRLDRAVNRMFAGESGPVPQLLAELFAASRQLDTALQESQ